MLSSPDRLLIPTPHLPYSLRTATSPTFQFARETVTETFRLVYGTDETPPPLVLTRRPVMSITSVTEDDVALVVADWELRNGECGWLGRLDGADRPRKWTAAKVVVTYVAGWNLPDVTNRDLPEDIEAAIISAVTAAWFSRGRDPSVAKEYVDGVCRTDYAPASGNFPVSAEALLDPYRIVTF